MNSENGNRKQTDNLCAVCPIEQDCCTHLTGLKLTKKEFNDLFAPFKDQLKIRKIGPVYEISIKGEGTCPYWENGCTVYEKRSIEARLFPYTMNDIRITRNKIRISYHSRTNCPFMERLLPSREEAEALILAFAREAFGPEIPVVITYENEFYRAKQAFSKLGHAGRFLKRLHTDKGL